MDEKKKEELNALSASVFNINDGTWAAWSSALANDDKRSSDVQFQ